MSEPKERDYIALAADLLKVCRSKENSYSDDGTKGLSGLTISARALTSALSAKIKLGESPGLLLALAVKELAAAVVDAVTLPPRGPDGGHKAGNASRRRVVVSLARARRRKNSGGVRARREGYVVR